MKRKTRAKRSGSKRDKLTAKQRLFVSEYLVDKNATQAAIRAGYGVKNARQQGTENLAKPVIVAKIEQALVKQMQRAQLTADDVMRGLACDILFDPAKLYDANGNLKSIHDMDLNTRMALRGLEVDEIKELGKQIGRTVKAKYPEKTTALALAMKHFRMFPQSGDFPVPPAGPANVDARTINFFNIPPEEAARWYREMCKAGTAITHDGK